MYNANYIKFEKASELSACIKRNEKKILNESILGFYVVEDLGGYSNSPIIFEFESYAVLVMYYSHSILEVNVCDKSSFYDGELTRRICGERQIGGVTQPFKEPLYASRLHKKIQGIEISRFEFPITNEFYEVKRKINKTDCFHKISLLFEDEKFTIYSESADWDGYMYYEFEHLDLQENNYLDLENVRYEKIL